MCTNKKGRQTSVSLHLPCWCHEAKKHCSSCKKLGLIHLLNGPYVTPVVAVWVRSSTIHQPTTHSLLEKYEKYAINKKHKKYGKWKQFIFCALYLIISLQMTVLTRDWMYQNHLIGFFSKFQKEKRLRLVGSKRTSSKSTKYRENLCCLPIHFV